MVFGLIFFVSASWLPGQAQAQDVQEKSLTATGIFDGDAGTTSVKGKKSISHRKRKYQVLSPAGRDKPRKKWRAYKNPSLQKRKSLTPQEKEQLRKRLKSKPRSRLHKKSSKVLPVSEKHKNERLAP